MIRLSFVEVMSTEDLSLDEFISKRRISSHRQDRNRGDRNRNYGYSNKRSRSPAFWEHDLYDEDGRGRPSRSSSRVRRPGMRSRSRSPLYRPRRSPHEREERTLDRSGCKIIIDNLDFGVTDDDMKVNSMQKVELIYNQGAFRRIWKYKTRLSAFQQPRQIDRIGGNRVPSTGVC
jgi:hypothetical protein